tara:strand:+ start:117 stop:515 length:399 start_codon:yes stop_codon:yes gene_type:complete
VIPANQDQDQELRKWWPVTLTRILDFFERGFAREGYGEEEALSLARIAALELAFYGNGQIIYLPKATRLKAAIRDRQIYSEFNGRNVSEIAARHQLSTIHVYKVLRQQRALRSKVNSVAVGGTKQLSGGGDE